MPFSQREFNPTSSKKHTLIKSKHHRNLPRRLSLYRQTRASITHADTLPYQAWIRRGVRASAAPTNIAANTKSSPAKLSSLSYPHASADLTRLHIRSTGKATIHQPAKLRPSSRTIISLPAKSDSRPVEKTHPKASIIAKSVISAPLPGGPYVNVPSPAFPTTANNNGVNIVKTGITEIAEHHLPFLRGVRPKVLEKHPGACFAALGIAILGCLVVSTVARENMTLRKTVKNLREEKEISDRELGYLSRELRRLNLFGQSLD